MGNTNDFVKKFKDTKKKDNKNRNRQGHGDPSKKLPNKRH
ncbi:DUF4023 domain-containing protein [Virgibacillus profundi]|uniref:DUF4023 domain-containing protein n=1 Tax=Virgibacillus profundi TaxID=2024555 RepID=A0A2A2IK96_9BACI|nr:DUF4023 family protein [Virgibacillus profundi]PAV31694.1 DUF4023 domain-containing protein [Virgibacillus profundi]PXY55880.1 DUF4023 domain-containing protein [Virgibacillus profundi]